ncbi:efflux RND transporter periplasmic adaptor subunit [Asticcacaulis sp. AC466]|uniref:efflux RND transporter periplasmic adaptor subunit n=1 Tax=Asticcacaulis sp. AC466 TaxID=1282362 RepID=UPI001F19964D|nr:efflux RND transporter periplasmic adaptor subunit [Asticcacaulis sp. AC466]
MTSGSIEGRKPGFRAVFAVGVSLALVLGSGLSACGEKSKTDGDKKGGASGHAAVVNFATARDATAPVKIAGTGTISAWQEVIVGAETGGLTAVALLVDEGQSVKQGQPLLRMNDVLLQAQLKQAQANYNQANKAYQRAQSLFQQGYLSAAALDNAEASKLTTEAAMQTAQTQLSMATVRAPVSGMVTHRTAVLGQNIQQGAELFRIVRDGRIELNMQVVESDLHNIHAGMAATVTSESTGPVTGSVRIVTPMVDPSTRLGYARISVPWSSGLRPGMFASGSIDAGMQNVLLIPQLAVVYTENVPNVYVIGVDNKAHLRKVVIGSTTPTKDIIIKEGLSVGDRVVTTGAGFLNDGDAVKATPQPGQPQTGGEH